MSEYNYIAPLDGGLLACITLLATDEQTSAWLMRVNLMYDGKPAGSKEFNLHGYSLDEAQTLARNLRQNAYLMQEIDEFLWGESD